jgi:ubiquinone/menaquinone biosynthesis C-methylase UbiE
MKKSSELWDRLASNYDLSVQKRYQATYQEMIGLSKEYLKENDLLLNVGCGTGISTIELAPYVKRIDSFDTSGKMIEIAINKARQ